MKTFLLACSAMALLIVAGCSQTNEPPTAKILEPANNLRATDLTVSFKGEVKDPEDKLKSSTWHFGDGVQEAGKEEVSHTYQRGGQYTVQLTATDDKDQTATASVTISLNQAPQAAARAQVTINDQTLPFVKAVRGEVPLQVKFEGSASKDPDGQIAGYRWDFGDGSTSQDPDPDHTYTDVGNYEAVLTVTDNEGASSTDRVVLNVEPKPVHISDFLETQTAVPPYALIKGSTIGANTNEALKTVLYSYRLTEQGPFTQEQIQLSLLDALLNLAAFPQISAATVYLFTEAKAGFMEPVDFDHYLGMATWERPEGSVSPVELAQHLINNTHLSYNQKYLGGAAAKVVGYQLTEAELDPEDPRCTICDTARMVYVNLVLNPAPEAGSEEPAPAPLCQQVADATIQAVVQRALQAPGAYGLNIYEGTVGLDTGIAVGLWGASTDISQVPADTGLLFEAVGNEEDWQISSDRFKLKYTKTLPQCGA